MVTMAKGGLSFLLFNLRKMLNHRITLLCVTAVLAFYVSWQAGSLVWKLWPINDASPQARALIPLSPKNTEPESLQNLLRYPLIQSASIPTTQGSASIDAPKTSLKLKLVGLMYSTDKNQARAIIENPKDGARSYATHERVADNAEIYSIEPDRVILFHAGKQEALMLDPEHKTSSFQSDIGNQPIDAPKNSAELMRDFSASPVMENGKLLGFRLKALRNPGIMKEWGINPNDVITAVNGIPLNAPGRVMVLYDKLKKQREFEITLNNGGNSRTITVDLYE
jgi:general secretion pathway protein C